MIPEDPPGALVRIEIKQAVYRHGWRIERGENGPWTLWASSAAPGAVAIAGAPGGAGPWFLAVDHPGVAAEIALAPADLPGPGVARFLLPTTGALHQALGRAFDLALALPDHPLAQFLEATQDMPRGTEAERLVIQRRGQDIFRESLMRYWDRRCPLTGICEPGLLRASHIKPWSDCETDAARLDPYNGLLLSALWDAAFDAGLVTFEDGGAPVFSSRLSPEARTGLPTAGQLPLTEAHRVYFKWHRDRVFEKKASREA